MAAHNSPDGTSIVVQTPEGAAIEPVQTSTGDETSIPCRGETNTADTVTSAVSNAPQETTTGSLDYEAPASASAASIPVSTPAPVPATAPTTVPNFPPPKTDKPRPHVCTTCMRSFARLEHLKRHERSHTKEKPFECPSCTRCFARRDLLLRHQQKLHSTTTPSSRPRNGRRESTTGVASGRVRKNSMASTPTTNMRPRANTLGHVDASASGMMASGTFTRQYAPMHAHHNSFSGIVSNPNFGFRSLGMSTNATLSGLPRLDTHGLPTDASSGLRTAPPFGGFGAEFDMGTFDSQDNGNTINPHALHMHSQSAFPMDCSWDASQHMYIGLPTSQTLTEEDGFDWVTHGFENQMNFAMANETAIDDSSPSAMSTNSPAHFNESGRPNQGFMDSTGQPMANFWPQSLSSTSQMVNSPMSMDVTSFFGDMAPPLVDTVSPKSLLAQKTASYEGGFPTPPELPSMDPAAAAMMQANQFAFPLKHENIASTASTASMDSSLRQSSVTTAASDLVTDHVRNVLIAGLNRGTGFGQRNPSQPSTSSPLSPASNKAKGFSATNFPVTQDLQRYVSAYIKYYHPHLPFLHVPTLNFESDDSASYRHGNGVPGHSASSLGAGSSCLMLSIAALGALFENEMIHSRELFECAKKLISSYLEERRRSQTSKSQYLPHPRIDQEDTPLWLVQAMLLNVIYGHNCGDKQAADIASNHCAALVSLARGAELAKPYPTYLTSNGNREGVVSPSINVNLTADGWNMLNPDVGDSDWYEWKAMEERKRTLYAIFVLSSMLVTAYNRAPALTNSEIRLDLPCDEELWSAESAHAWRSLGGVATAEAGSVRFASALTHLLTAAQRQRRAAVTQAASEPWQHDVSDLRPSSFGCLVLINALHNYIWETRQRHLGRQWTPQEIDSMHAHIEPALRAWQSAWRSNPTHTIERPNPFGAGPLSADSIPLLDLAYVRLFVDFGRSKEAYWQRDYDAMAQELARGSEISTDGAAHQRSSENGDTQPHVQINDNILEHLSGENSEMSGSQATQRERHLRKAAFYAADHLMASDRLGLGLSEHNARELPIQSVLCACDSAQVLAEWATTVQERVGKYIGIIGRDDIDFMQVPAALLLDEEDRKLFGTIHELLTNAESRRECKMALIDVQDGGYGSRILVLISDIMTRAAVWPVTKHMARCLEIQSNHVKTRAVASIQAH